MMLAMMLATYMLPQRAGVRFTVLPTESLGDCTEQAPGEETLQKQSAHPEQRSTDGSVTLLANTSEEETEGDDFLLSEFEFILPGQGWEHSFLAQPVHSSHIGTLSRRPPRLSIA